MPATPAAYRTRGSEGRAARASTGEHRERQRHDHSRGTGAQNARRPREPLTVKPRIQPPALEHARLADRVGQHDQRAPDAQSEEPVNAPRPACARSAGADAVQREQAEVLGGEMVGDERVVEDHQRDHALRAREGKGLVPREQRRETGRGDRERNDDEAHRVGPEQRPVGGRRVGQPRGADAVADPEQGGEAEVKNVQRAPGGIGMAVRKQ